MADLVDLDIVEALIEERFGLSCAGWQKERLAAAVKKRLHRVAAPQERSREELLALASEITVGETYFFREATQIDALIEAALPERARAGAPGRGIRILSAGCASGEEAYSLALAIGDRAPAVADRVAIHGIDLSAAAIGHARRGVYAPWALRAVPAEVRDRCFHPAGGGFRLKDEHRAQVTFEQRNLLDDPALWAPSSFDVIFCRNVTIYFSERALRAAVARFSAALAPGGFLFLGHAETLRGLSDEFELRFTQGAVYHRRKGPSESRTRPAAPAKPDSWIEAIRRASERVAELTRRAGEPDGSGAPAQLPPLDPRPHLAAAAAPQPPSRDPPPAAAPGHALEPLRRLVAAERFEEGLARLRAMPEEASATSDARLLEALMLSGLGRIDEVERVCGRLVVATGGHAGAHYLLGLCREHARDSARAADHYREAVRIDPAFAMAHVRAGLLARSTGDHLGARLELRQARARLDAASAEHLLLFGGGFSREVLQGLCRTDRVAGSAP